MLLALLLSAGGAELSSAQTPETVAKPTSKTLDGFSLVRQEVVTLIAAATKRVWLTADYLTDGDVVSGLYLAQYRKINVQVLLGRKKSNAYMSRLGFLNAQNIPVFLKPDGFLTAPTVLYVDDLMIAIDGDLDFKATYKKFTLSTIGAAEAKVFEGEFAKAANVAIPARADPIPLVGRNMGGQGKYYTGSAAAAPEPAPGAAGYRGKRYRPAMGSAKFSDEEMRGSYGYNYRDRKAPKGIPKMLPKHPLYQKLEEERQRTPPPPEPVTAPQTLTPTEASPKNPEPAAPAVDPSTSPQNVDANDVNGEEQ